MSNQLSVTIIGLVVVAIGKLAELSGVHILPADIQTTIETLIQIGGVLLAWYGRVRKGDINWLGFKK